MSLPSISAPLQVLPEPSRRPRPVHPPRRAGRFALLGHAPALDGLRGLAVLLVVIYHFVGHHAMRGGWAGVDVFFALSGFLITALLLDERRVRGRVELGRFYARRACRLLPALALVLVVWTGLLLAFHDQGWLSTTPSGNGRGHPLDVGACLRDLAVVLAYFANWMYAVFGGSSIPLPHFWSLAVEEQFYLLWPAALLLLAYLSHRRVVTIVLGMATVSAVLPWLYWDGGVGKDRIYFGTDTRAVGLLAGAVCALLWHRRRSLGRAPRYAGTRAWLGLAFVLAVAWNVGNVPAKFLVLPTLLGVAVSQLIPYLADGGGRVMGPLFRVRWLVWAGKRSYALYLWHYLWATWTHPLPPLVGVPLGVAGALACTVVSWHLVEARALRWGSRFKTGTAPPVVARGAA